MAPRILLSCSQNKENYTNAVNSLGADACAEYCPSIDVSYDGLILCGGSDVHPNRYGQEINGSRRIDLDRDSAEFALLDAYVKEGKPIMGICRGMQLINIYFGGTLIQHLNNADDHYAPQGGDNTHRIEADEGSIIRGIYGKEFSVNSRHHQAADVLGNGIKAVAKCCADGVVEAIEHTSLPIFALQWHPERMCYAHRREDTVDGSAVIRHFINMCAKEKS